MSSNQRLPNYLFNKKVAFPNLEEVEIRGVHKVKMIWGNQLFLNLREVHVSWCRNLTSIFPASVALALKQLEILEIDDCENLKEIVSKEEEEEDGGPTLVFSKLTYLHFQDLPELERFYGGGADISDWASNELIEAPSNLSIQKVDALFAKEIVSKEEEENGGPTFVFPKLTVLWLEELPKLEGFYKRGADISDWASNKLIEAPSNLNVQKRDALFAKVAFPNLEHMSVSGCRNLTSIFPASVASALKQLETLSISDCKNLKEIVSKEEEEDGGPTFVFPKLTMLYLEWLPELERFYGGGPDISDWASNKLIEAPSYLKVQKVDTLFAAKVVLPKLEKLVLRWLKVDRIWDDQFAIEAERINCCFQNLTTLQVWKCNNLSYLFTSSMVRSRSQLKELEVKYCESIEQIVTTKGEMAGDEEEIIEFTQLRILRLENLDRLISFFSSSTPNPIISSSQERHELDPMSSNQRLSNSLFNKKVVLPKLEVLELKEIKVDRIWDDQLAIDVQRINCWFQNLTTLQVRECNNLSYMFTSSMVRSLAQLKVLDVWNCQSIEEIVATKGEMAGDKEEIIEFTQLRKLRLDNLGRLISFYSNSTPTPIISSSHEKQEHDPLSSNQRLPTLLFNKKVVLPKLEELHLKGSKVDQIWNDQFAIEADRIKCCFQNLTTFKVTSCHKLSYLFTSSMVKNLTQLKELEVMNCESIEEVVATKGEMVEDEDDVMCLFPALNSLWLESLPMLRRFCRDTNFFECQSWGRLEINSCPKLIRT